MKNITKRDLKFLLLGFFCYFSLNVFLDWNENTEAFLEGYNEGKAYFLKAND
ncbi:hypothetical protein INR75_09825 [Zunongwangia sp. SCSIO 43204]|uniref:hypothetical protein n=1 Tax=Zunongwangia sp. SCSIO 43204 TaxID=2779359 RepID=UPI001CA9FD7B|nr:hypothetical protein [Zunongwangia sp. SCSIO 43204]UAB86263.1 hypothetical protein INR75_09825 [Zunongwangia sp. SCSIO 43204]